MLVTLRRERGKTKCFSAYYQPVWTSVSAEWVPVRDPAPLRRSLRELASRTITKEKKIKYCSKFQLTFRCNPGLRWLCLTLQLWKISWPNTHKFSRKYRLPEWNFLKSSRSSGLTILSPGTKHLKNITIVFPANQSCGSGHNSSCLKLKL